MTQIKIFLDTNIVADMIDSSRNNHFLALDFLKKSIINDYKLYISEDMISTLYYISKDKINIKAIYLQDRPETQREICYNLKKYFEIIEQGRFKR